jgi:DNA-binding NarL/FixJ family response regulator
MLTTGLSAIRVVLIDDHELFRTTLGQSLRNFGFEVMAEGSDPRAMFPRIDEIHPDLLLLDLRLPTMDGLTALRELRGRDRDLKIVMLTSSELPHDINGAWAAGAHGYATKLIGLEALVEGLHSVLLGRRFLQQGLQVDGRIDLSQGPLGPLSPRERDVFRLIVLGLTSADIARQLCISIKTAQTHRDRILTKLQLHSAVQLARFAAANGLMPTT